MKTIFAIIGSASENSSNKRLVEFLADSSKNEFNWIIFNELKSLPHFDPELSVNNTPKEILAFRKQIEQADAVLICTPEYVFSIPSGLKNALEWCVSTTLFSDKPTGLITASAQGERSRRITADLKHPNGKVYQRNHLADFWSKRKNNREYD